MSHGNRIAAVVIEVSDLDRSATLYRDGFGIELKPPSDHAGDDRWTSGRHCAFSWTEGAFLHFALYEAKDGPTRNVQIGVSVADLDAAHATALDAGAELVHPPKPQPWGRSARYRDPDGNIIELTQPG